MEQAQLPIDAFDMPLVQGSAKKAMTALSTPSRDLWQVELGQIKLMPNFNVRIHDEEYEEHINWLTESMVANGYRQESTMEGFVAKEGDELIIYLKNGHSRLQAIERANKRLPEDQQIKRVPMIVASQGTDIQDMTLDLILSNSGKPLRPYEMAIVFKRLVRYGWQISAIAKQTNFTTTYVEGLLLLAGAPAEIRDMVISGQVAAAVAIQEMRQHGSKAVERLQAGLAAAQAKGSARVTNKHLPGAALKKVLKKEANNLYQAARSIKQDPGFASLKEETRVTLEALLEKLQEAENDLATQGEGSGGNQTDSTTESNAE